MDRRASIFRTAISCLIIFWTSSTSAESFNLAEISQIKGEVTSLQFSAPHTKTELSKNSVIRTETSILSHENSFYTAKLFDGSWVRVSPRTKLSFNFYPQEKIIEINLYSGSIKILFSTHLNDHKVEKIIINSADLKIESVDGKFSIIRNNLINESSVYVEKGLVIGSSTQIPHKQAILHAREKLVIQDRLKTLPETDEITEKEMKYIHSRFYLKSI